MIRSVIVLGLGASQATHAQEADSRAAAKPATLEEIVVTVERRSERLDQVPIAATVISGEDLSQHGVSNIQDLGTASGRLRNIFEDTLGKRGYKPTDRCVCCCQSAPGCWASAGIPLVISC